MRLVVNGNVAELFDGDKAVLRVSSEKDLTTEVLDSDVIDTVQVNQFVEKPGKAEPLVGVTAQNEGRSSRKGSGS